MTLIDVKEAVFGYGQRPVVRVDDLHLHSGRCTGVFGPNGAGKTTLIRGVTGLLPPLSGEVDRPAGVRFGYIPQYRSMELHWPMTGLDAAALAVSARRTFGWMGGGHRRRVLEAMRLLGVEDLKGRRFAKLSGGQQQRLLLAGALASDPTVLVLDEPTDGLDVRSRRNLLDLLRQTAGNGVSVVIISHEIEDLLDIADQVAWLHPGEAGQPSSVEVITPEQFAHRVTEVRRS